MPAGFNPVILDHCTECLSPATMLTAHTFLPFAPRLQVHYTNPQLLTGQRDHSGLRLLYTPRLRPHDMGNLWVGTVNFEISPGQKAFPTPINLVPCEWVQWALLLVRHGSPY